MMMRLMITNDSTDGGERLVNDKNAIYDNLN